VGIITVDATAWPEKVAKGEAIACFCFLLLIIAAVYRKTSINSLSGKKNFEMTSNREKFKFIQFILSSPESYIRIFTYVYT